MLTYQGFSVYGRLGMSDKGEGMNCGSNQMQHPHMIWSLGENGSKVNDKEDVQK